MKKVSDHLYVGDGVSAYSAPGHFFVVHAAKEPWHREALGYTTHGAPKDHPHYLWIGDDDSLTLNMIDADDSRYIPEAMVDHAIDMIDRMVTAGRDVLIHCNRGQSRSPGLALLYMHQYTTELPSGYEAAVAAFKRLYPDYEPARGVRDYVKAHW